MPKFTKQSENFKTLVRKVRKVSPEAAQKLVTFWNSSEEYKNIIEFKTYQNLQPRLIETFIFRYTKEGYEYWNNISIKLGE